MPDEGEEFLQQLRSPVEKRVREQLRRHARIDPDVNYGNVVNIQIGQEAERLERMYEKYDDDGQDGLAEAIRALIDDWLPELANILKRRG